MMHTVIHQACCFVQQCNVLDSIWRKLVEAFLDAERMVKTPNLRKMLNKCFRDTKQAAKEELSLHAFHCHLMDWTALHIGACAAR